MRICVLEHEPEAPAGYFADWAEDRGHSTRVIAVPALESWPELDAQDLIVSLGSDCSVHGSPDPWIPGEIAFVRDAHSASIPFLGICFGAQILAAALGGRVRRAPAAQVDWREIPTVAPELIDPGPWFRWHEDVFESPAGARLLAGSDTEPLAFSHDRSVGLQFHPEVDRRIVEGWIEGGREQLSAQGIDELRLRADIEQSTDGARERAFSLFDRLATSFW